MHQSVWMFVATYPEWLNWIAVGRIRCNGRITRLAGVDDTAGFALLMDRAPDVSIDDDQAFIIARLKSDFRTFQEDVSSANSPELTWLLLSGVDEFIPVSDRGARLIEADAQRAKAKIGHPVFQKSWQAWTSTQQRTRADCRGRTLAKVMGLGVPDLSVIPTQISDYLIGKIALPNAEKLSELSATNAFAWASSFAVFGALVGEEFKRSQSQELGLNEVIRKLRNDYSVKDPISKDSNLKDLGLILSGNIKSRVGVDISILQMVVVFHYSDVIASGKEITLGSLVKDIGEVVMECGPVAGANTAYMIGRIMDDIAVTTLEYASTPLSFSSMVPKQLPFAIDVGIYVVERQIELAQQHTRIVEVEVGVGVGVDSIAALDVALEQVSQENISDIQRLNVQDQISDCDEPSKRNDSEFHPTGIAAESLVDKSVLLDVGIVSLAIEGAIENGLPTTGGLFPDIILNEVQARSQRLTKTTGGKKKKEKS